MQRATTGNILGALAQTLHDAVDARVAGETGHAGSAAAALVHLSKYAGERIDALRRPLGLSHPGCVRLIDRLQADGLLRRKPGPDGRSRALVLTAAGERAAAAVLRARAAALDEALGGLSRPERATLVELLSRILIDFVGSEDDALALCRLCDYDACPDDVCPSARALERLAAP